MNTVIATYLIIKPICFAWQSFNVPNRMKKGAYHKKYSVYILTHGIPQVYFSPTPWSPVECVHSLPLIQLNSPNQKGAAKPEVHRHLWSLIQLADKQKQGHKKFNV